MLEGFLDRFVPVAPGQKITHWVDESPCPTGFRLVRYSMTSSNPSMDRSSALLLADDGRAVFAGHAMPLVDPVSPRDPRGPETLSRYFSAKAGRTMKVRWDNRPGPGGAFPARIAVESPGGEVRTLGALSRDGRWFLFGTFFPLDQDPRAVRVRRLALAGRVSLGPPEASVTLVEISDLQCPKCAELQPLLEGLVDKYAPDLRLVRVDLPEWQVHDWGMRAAEWSRCVASLSPSAYWPFVRAVYGRQGVITAATFGDLLRPVVMALGIRTRDFDACGNSERARAGVLADIERVSDAGLEGTPTVLVNGALVDSDFENLLEPAIARELGTTATRVPPKAGGP